jgi:hypothetical protein
MLRYAHLMIAVAAAASNQEPIHPSTAETQTSRTHRLFEQYVDAMLERYRPSSSVSRDRLGAYMRFLSSRMLHLDQAAFYVEGLDRDWLSPLARVIVGSALAALVGLLVALTAPAPFRTSPRIAIAIGAALLSGFVVARLPGRPKSPSAHLTTLLGERPLLVGLVSFIVLASIAVSMTLPVGSNIALIGIAFGGLYAGHRVASLCDRPSDRLRWSWRDMTRSARIWLSLGLAGGLVAWLAEWWRGGVAISPMIGPSLATGIALGVVASLLIVVLGTVWERWKGSWSGTPLRRRVGRCFKYGLIGGGSLAYLAQLVLADPRIAHSLIGGLVLGLGVSVLLLLCRLVGVARSRVTSARGLGAVILLGLGGGVLGGIGTTDGLLYLKGAAASALLVGCIQGIIAGFVSEEMPATARLVPNEGFRRSFKGSLMVGALAAILWTLADIVRTVM